jgi:hypothetical protein
MMKMYTDFEVNRNKGDFTSEAYPPANLHANGWLLGIARSGLHRLFRQLA